MRETQETIEAWRLATFGPGGSNARLAARANEELSELLRALTINDNSPEAAEECADLLIVLYGLASRLDMDLDKALMYVAGETMPDYYPNHANYAVHMLKDMAMILDDLTTIDDHPMVRASVNSLAYKVVRLTNHMGILLPAEVDRKMATNRTREWMQDGSGHGYHVRVR